MRKRVPVVIGGGIALILASQYFDFGLGFNNGDGSVVSTVDPASSMPTTDGESNDSVSESSVASAAPKETPDSQDPAAEPVTPDVVDVVIDGNQYLVVTDANQPDEREVMDLDQIVAFVALVDGEPSGIRVRIARTPNAIASAEQAILKRLDDAQVDSDQIDARRQLLE